MCNLTILLLFTANVVYCIVNFTAALSLVRLAKCWSKLMKLAEETEQSLTLLKLDRHVIRKTNIIAIIMIVMFLGMQLSILNC